MQVPCQDVLKCESVDILQKNGLIRSRPLYMRKLVPEEIRTGFPMDQHLWALPPVRKNNNKTVHCENRRFPDFRIYIA